MSHHSLDAEANNRIEQLLEEIETLKREKAEVELKLKQALNEMSTSEREIVLKSNLEGRWKRITELEAKVAAMGKELKNYREKYGQISND